jgi:hypothetical protein
MLLSNGSLAKPLNLQRNTPNPININFVLNIWCEYEEDLNQILTNFIPFFNPHIFVSCRHPLWPEEVVRSQIIWDGTVQNDFSSYNELDGTQNEFFKASVNFTYKTWNWFGTYTGDPINSDSIQKVIVGDSERDYYIDLDGNIISFETDTPIILKENDKGKLNPDLLITISDGTDIIPLHYDEDGNLVDGNDIIYINADNTVPEILSSGKSNPISEINLPAIIDPVNEKEIAYINPFENTIQDINGNQLLIETTPSNIGKINMESDLFSGCFQDGFFVIDTWQNIDLVDLRIRATKRHKDLPYHDDLILWTAGDEIYLTQGAKRPSEVQIYGNNIG